MNHRLVAKYIAKHRDIYVRFSLEAMDFFTAYHHLAGSERAAFYFSSARFLHVILQRVNSQGKGQHNKLQFAVAAVRETSELEAADAIIPRLYARFPAVLLGFTVFDPLSRAEARVTTITHTFPWPEPKIESIGTDKVIECIAAAENALQAAGKA